MNRKSFTLIEIIIVIAVISLLAAIAIPIFLRVSIFGNESAAIAALKTLSSAVANYRITHPTYPPDLSALYSESPPYIDSILASGTKQGYNFDLRGNTYGFEVTANPVSFGKTGRRYFFMDETGVIRYDETGPATNSSPPIE